MSDDVHAPDESSNNERLNALFKRMWERGLTLTEQKCQFNQSSISLFGLIFSAKGLSPGLEKIDGIHQAASPKSAHEFMSLLGMASYSARFIPNISTITAPLRRLIEKGVKFEWSVEHEAALKVLKNLY